MQYITLDSIILHTTAIKMLKLYEYLNNRIVYTIYKSAFFYIGILTLFFW